MLVKVRRGARPSTASAPIPLGGYVKITGMNPSEEIPPEDVARAYYNQPVWKRIVVILAGPAMNLLIAFVILWGLLLANGQVVPSTRVVGTSEARTAAAGVLRPGDQIVSVDGSAAAQEEQLRSAIAPTAAPGAPGQRLPGRRRPATLVVLRDGQLVDHHDHAALRRQRRPAADRLRVRLGDACTRRRPGAASARGAPACGR